MRSLKASLIALAAIVIAAGTAAAQTTTGTITGRVNDTQGLSVPGVTVNVQSPNLQGIVTVVTSKNGDYIVPLIPPGAYTVSFESSGFGRQERRVTLAGTQTEPHNIQMR